MAATLLWANNPGNDSEYDKHRDQKLGSMEEHGDHDEDGEFLSSQELPRAGARLNGQAQPKGSQYDANSQTRSHPNGIFRANEQSHRSGDQTSSRGKSNAKFSLCKR